MNAYMNINVRVLSANAQAQIKALQTQVAGLERQVASANAAAAAPSFLGGANTRKTLGQLGSQLQGAGRQLQYNFTLPILLAAGAATKFALDNEKAMTRIQKVYGDTDDATVYFKRNTEELQKVLGDTRNEERLLQIRRENPGITNEAAAAQAVFANETDALGRAMEAMSTKYGVAQKDVLETGSAWAAAGVSGAALAKSTEISIKAAVLGDLDLAKATESLIAIQSQYSLNTKELNLTLAELNSIENQTGISMAGLIEGFARSAGTAREFGVDVRHLGAMLAALVPATGSAASAGNSLKTIMSRLLNPTKAATEVMNAFGVSTEDASWKNATAMDRLQIIADKMNGTLRETGNASKDTADDMYAISDSQRAVVASTLGSNYQVNRFLVLMRELGPEHTYYEKALNATKDDTKVFATATKELNAVLESSPQRLKIIWTTLQNGMADAIQPIIPYFLYLASVVSRAMQAFSDLDPALQKLIITFLLLIALLAPMLRLFGAVVKIISLMSAPFVVLSGVVSTLVGGFGSLFKVTKTLEGVATQSTRTWVRMINPFQIISDLIAKVGARFAAAVTGLAIWNAASDRVRAGARTLASVVENAFERLGSATSATRIGGGVLDGIVAIAGKVPQIFETKIVPAFFAGMAYLQNVVVGKFSDIGFRIGWAVGGFGPILEKALFGLLGIAVAWGARLDITFAQIWVRIAVGFERMGIALMGAMTFLRSTFLAGWTGMYLGMVAIGEAASKAMLVIQTTAFRLQLAAQAAFNAASVSATTLWGTAQAAVTRAYYGAMLVLDRGFAAVRLNVQFAWAAASQAAQSAWAAGMLAIQRAWSTAMLTIFLGYNAAVATVQAAGSTVIRTIWGGMLAAKTALSVAFWSRMIALYVAGMLNLKRVALAGARFMAGPWGLLITTVLSLMWHFRDELKTIWNNIISYFSDSSNAVVTGVINAFNALPAGVTNALIAVARVVKQVALQIYDWFSYINPFARHSPSLVENVTAGTAEVSGRFAAMSDSIGNDMKRAYGNIKSFGSATRGLIKNAQQQDVAKDRKQIKKFAPGALNEFDALQTDLKALNKDLAVMERRVDSQQKVVDHWADKLDKANEKLDEQQKRLDDLSKVQKSYQDLLDAASDRLSAYASAPVVGMKAMSDAIFDNEMAQKSLRLEMLRMEEVGGTLDDIKKKLAAINGEQDLLRGQQADLRNAGAGSDILKSYDDQIKALEDQKKALTASAAPIQAMTDQLAALEHQASIMDLEQSLAFDPLTRQIDAAANAMKEMPFDQIMEGIRGAKADMDMYGAALTAATQAVDDQQSRVEAATAKRDAIQATLDAETTRLDNLKQRYDAVTDSINDVTDALNIATQAAGNVAEKAEEAKKKAKKEPLGSPALQNFKAAAGGNFAQVGGSGIPIRTDFSDQSSKIDDFTKKLGDSASGAFAGLNPFAPIMKYWDKFKTWFGGVWGEVKSIATDALSNIFSGVSFGEGGGGDIIGKVKSVVQGIKTAFTAVVDFFRDNIVGPIMSLWRLFWPDIEAAANNAWAALKPILSQFGHEFSKWGELLSPAIDALGGLWDVAKIVLGWLIIRFSFVAKIITSVFASVIGPLITTIGKVILNAFQMIRGVVQFVIGFFQLIHGIFTGNSDMIKDAFKLMGAGVLNLVSGLFGGIGQIIWGSLKVIVGAVWGIVKGVFGWFHWLWDELIGHSVIPDIVNGIKFWFNKLITLAAWLFDNVLKPIFSAFTWLFGVVISAVRLWWSGIMLEWAILKTLGSWFWDNVLKPVWDVVVWLWEKAVQPAIAFWWEGIKAEWAILKTLASWFWDYVLKPVWDVVVWLWDNAVKPALSAWWEAIKLTWAVLKTLGKWFWDNVLKPVWDRVVDLWQQVGPELITWWERIKLAWAVIKLLGGWFWDNILKPVFDKVVDLWTKVGGEISVWKGRFEAAWDSLKQLGKWFKDNVMDPIFDAVTGVWGRIKTFFDNNKDLLVGGAKGIVNTVIDAVNALINGLNGISKALPGIDFEINTIQKFEQGGEMPSRRVGAGFRTSGARAIVGEGKANYPEYVIPTDPTYRRRAQGLLLDAGNRLGMGSSLRGVAGDTPSDMRKVLREQGQFMFKEGGILGKAKSVAGAIKGTIKNAGDDALNAIKNPQQVIAAAMGPGFGIARKLVNSADWAPPRALGNYAIDNVQSFVSGTQKALTDAVKEAGPPANVKGALEFARSQVGKPYDWGGVGADGGGYDCSGFMAAITHVLRGENPHSRIGTTATFPWAGFSTMGPLNPNGFVIGSTSSYAGGVGHMAGTLGGVNVESRGGTGVIVGSSARGYLDSGFNVRAQLGGLKEGGIALASRGPSIQAIGDGRYDEAVVPLPKGWRSNGPIGSSGGDTFNFYGDMSFPNIESGDDAKTFLDNLKNLAKD